MAIEQRNERCSSKVRSTNVEQSSQRASKQETEIKVCSNSADEDGGKASKGHTARDRDHSSKVCSTKVSEQGLKTKGLP